MTLAHQVQGDGEHPVLLLNGGMMTHAVWEPVAARLVETGRYRVIRCDFRGQFLTPGPPPTDLAGHAADVGDLVDSLGPDLPARPVHVVGTSFGGEVGLALAATCPDRVASISAVTVTDHLTEEMIADVDATRRQVAAVRAGGDRGELQRWVAREVYSEEFRETHESFLAAVRERSAELPERWFDDLDGILAAYRGTDLRPLLPAIRCPVLVVIAGSDRVMPPERSRALAAALEGAPEVVMVTHPESGHALVVERPRWLADTCLAFLDRQIHRWVGRRGRS